MYWPCIASRDFQRISIIKHRQQFARDIVTSVTLRKRFRKSAASVTKRVLSVPTNAVVSASFLFYSRVKMQDLSFPHFLAGGFV